MSSHACSLLPRFTDLVSDQKLFYKELVKSEYLTKETPNDVDENFYELNEFEEVFADHILMGKRLQKTLYGGNIEDMDDKDLHHPPIALTDLALKLFSKTVPNYGLDLLDMDYVSSVSEVTRISPCAMILAMIYLERLQTRNSDYLECVSPSGLFVVTMLVASKFLFENEEDIVTNQIWAEALNLDVKELNRLEQNFLSAIEWRLYVDSSEYFQYLSGLEKMIAIKQSSLRGWLSYSDIYSILQDAIVRKFLLSCIERIIKISAISAVGYLVTIFSVCAAGYAVHYRHIRNQRPSLKGTINIRNNEQVIQKPVIDFSDIDLTPDVTLPEEKLSEEKPMLSKISFSSSHLHKYENKDLSSELLKKNVVNLSSREYSVCSKSASYTILHMNIYDSFHLESSVQNIKVIANYTLYKLYWWSSSFKNVCIPVLVK